MRIVLSFGASVGRKNSAFRRIESEHTRRPGIIASIAFRGGTFFFRVKLLGRLSDLLVTQIDTLRDAARRAGPVCPEFRCRTVWRNARKTLLSQVFGDGEVIFPMSDANFSPPAGKTEKSDPPTMMIAETGAAVIKGAARQRLAA
jgi:hypothetical protein